MLLIQINTIAYVRKIRVPMYLVLNKYRRKHMAYPCFPEVRMSAPHNFPVLSIYSSVSNSVCLFVYF